MAKSLPSWERGLKLHPDHRKDDMPSSLPSWERGLKCVLRTTENVCGTVAPFVGVWIEMKICNVRT